MAGAGVDKGNGDRPFGHRATGAQRAWTVKPVRPTTLLPLRWAWPVIGRHLARHRRGFSSPIQGTDMRRQAERADTVEPELLDHVLAVSYVLSYAAQWVGFLTLVSVGAFLCAREGVDVYSGGLVLAGLAWVGLWTVYRPCVRWWGLRRARKLAEVNRLPE